MMDFQNISSIKSLVEKYELDHYVVPDLNLENADTIFILESPHMNEVKKGYPAAGSSGVNMSRQLLEEESIKQTSLGKLIFTKKITNYGIMNISNIPLQGKVYKSGDINEIMENLFWIRNRITTDRNAITAEFKDNPELKKYLIKLLLKSFEDRFSTFENKKIVLCGNFSKAFYCQISNIPKNNLIFGGKHPAIWYSGGHYGSRLDNDKFPFSKYNCN